MFAQLLSRHILQSTRKQFCFRRNHAGEQWHFDKSSGVLTLDGKTRLAAEILGTYSIHSGSWLWSWANDFAGIPTALTKASRMMRDFGVSHHVSELTEAERQVDEDFNHELIGMVAIGLLEMPCFFHAEHADGSVLLIITDRKAKPLPAINGMEFINHVLDITSRVPVADHRLAVLSFGTTLGWRISMQSEVMILQPSTALPSITAEFDAQNRLIRMNTTVTPKA